MQRWVEGGFGPKEHLDHAENVVPSVGQTSSVACIDPRIAPTSLHTPPAEKDPFLGPGEKHVRSPLSAGPSCRDLRPQYRLGTHKVPHFATGPRRTLATGAVASS